MTADDPTTDSAPPQQGLPPGASAAYLQPGDVVGPYVIRGQIGEGGFAVVFCADQVRPVRRQVALKIIKLGMDTRQVIARFDAERQALAMMDHPNVAKVLDAGVTDTGRPYFAMELVAGTPINEYCDRHKLRTDQRLDLFTQVCDAVQHAHHKALIHRDIKPSNVLVTVSEGSLLVKVIDFGVAKAISHRLTEKTIYTEQGQLIGTPEYMSPEQAEMTAENVDTRSDIYSLGVLLYELLVGALPFDPATLRQASFSEIQSIIREQEPPRPSTRLGGLGEASSAAQQRGVDVRTLSAELKGDLDWVVMKALEKDRTRRYESASGFAADIRRYLAHEPVLARPPSAGYRLRKFARRNRVAVLAGSAVGVILIASLIVSVGFALSEAHQRELAEKALARAHEQRALVLQDRGRKALEEGAIEIAELHYREAVESFEDAFGQSHTATFGMLNELADLLRMRGNLVEAEELYRRALATRPEVRGWDSGKLKTQSKLAMVLLELGRAEGAERLAREVVERGVPQHPPSLARSKTAGMYLARHGRTLWALGRYTEAEARLLEAMRVPHVTANEDQAELVAGYLAELYDSWDKPEKAAEWRDAARVDQRVVASDPADAPDVEPGDPPR